MASDPSRRTYINLGILETFLQVVVDCFIRYLAEQRQVRHANLFLLGAFEDSLLDLQLSPTTGGWGACCRTGVFFTPSTLGNSLQNHH